jgi:hypothetical protein
VAEVATEVAAGAIVAGAVGPDLLLWNWSCTATSLKLLLLVRLWAYFLHL